MHKKISDSFTPDVLRTASDIMKKSYQIQREQELNRRENLSKNIERVADGIGYTKFKPLNEGSKESKYAKEYKHKEKMKNIRDSVKAEAEGKSEESKKKWDKAYTKEDYDTLSSQGFSDIEIDHIYLNING